MTRFMKDAKILILEILYHDMRLENGHYSVDV